MKTLKICDMEPTRRVLAVDLRHVLVALEQRAISSRWFVQDVWVTGDSTAETMEKEQMMSGERLSELAQHAVQVIEGVFSAFDSGCNTPWCIIEAVDSSYYLVRSDEPEVLKRIRQRFKDVFDYETKPS